MDYGEPSGLGRFWFVLIASPFSVLLLVGLLRTSTSMLIRGGLILMSGYLLLNGEEFFGSQQIIPSGFAFLLIAWTGLTFTRTTQKGPALVALLGFGFVLMVGDFRTLDDVFDDLLGIDNMTRAYGMWSIIFGGSVLALSAAIESVPSTPQFSYMQSPSPARSSFSFSLPTQAFTRGPVHADPPRKPTVRRGEMLRHSKFIQFPAFELTGAVSPSQFHWRIQEQFEDQGIRQLASVAPQVISRFHKGVPGENGNEASIVDYMPFDGSLKGVKYEPLPVWLNPAQIIALILTPILAAVSPAGLAIGVLAVAGLASFRWYWITYRGGTFHLLYRAIYAPDPENPKAKPRLLVDLMLSVDVKKEFGRDVAIPVFDILQNSLVKSTTGVSTRRTMDELISRKSDYFERRFPVKNS